MPKRKRPAGSELWTNRQLGRFFKCGISPTEWDMEWIKQESRCRICYMAIVDEPGRLRKNSGVADHNHKTGKFRGIVCISCNAGLGLFDDSINLLMAAIKYLEESGQHQDSKSR